MKLRTTQRAVKSSFSHVVRVGYCTLQSLLSTTEPFAYTARVEGWGADIYGFGSVAIATGYAPFGDIRPSYEVCRKYNDAARQINNDIELSFGERCEKLQDLIHQFIGEVTK